MTGIYAENSEGIFKKSVLEAASYASKIQNGPVTAICVGKPNEGESDKLAKYGVNKLIVIDGLNAFDAQMYSEAVTKAVVQAGINTLVIANTYEAKSIAPRIAVGMNASLATNVIAYPDMSNGFTVKRGVFSGKGFAYVKLEKTNKIVAITPNSTELIENNQSIAVENISAEQSNSSTQIISTSKAAGKNSFNRG